ncbi:hypothetical protein C8F04DRAFT_1091926 [Mycena alexandri]|uniref:FAD-binding domain-containing protein n=1 Tax=Mycena alexandri TaxID=1745969 RepID=A0AAD6T0X1_9AGAR|nr:hypothetical protein C8F04DRAFT_1091926 [Mycena alexandri]
MVQDKPSVILFDGRVATHRLRILIIGGGIAGIAAAFCLGKAGHDITVVEAAPAATEVGAGIQVTPNMSRLLIRWGMGERLGEAGVKPLSVSFRRYSNGERVGRSPFGTAMEFEYGAPYYHVHRADLLGMLLEIAAPYMTLRLGSRVISLNAQAVSATLASGEVLYADVILGADGIKSTTRQSIFAGLSDPVPSGDSVYRAILPTAKMMKDPLLKPLISVPEVTCWMGPGKHVVGYCVRGATEYNLVLLCPDTMESDSSDSWTAKGDVEEMRSTYRGWEPRVEKLLQLVETATMGKLVVRRPLTTWVDSTRRITLIGDACHPMLPYRAQGAAMALEDAAVLGNIFSRLSHKDHIGQFLDAYQQIRIGRTTSTQAASWSNRKTFHLPDGPAQELRDQSMRLAMVGVPREDSIPEGHKGNANMWADKEKNLEQFGYDADEAVNEWWRKQRTIPLHPELSKL